MQTQIETITPESASEYLKANRSNRPLKKALVNNYARAMANGEWRLTHQGVAFNCDGILLDGQHRLKAVEQSGHTIQMVVTRGVSKDAQLVMDDHAKRSAGDALSISRGEKITQAMVATIRGCVELQRTSYNTATMTKQEINKVLDRFAGPLEFINSQVRCNERGVTSAPVRSAIALAWYYVDDLDRLAEFCEILFGRQMPTEQGDRSAVVIREWLLRNGVKNNQTRVEAFRKTQRAILAFMERESLTKLYGTNVYYPWPLVDPIR